jgi:hypothetical protein
MTRRKRIKQTPQTGSSRNDTNLLDQRHAQDTQPKEKLSTFHVMNWGWKTQDQFVAGDARGGHENTQEFYECTVQTEIQDGLSNSHNEHSNIVLLVRVTVAAHAFVITACQRAVIIGSKEVNETWRAVSGRGGWWRRVPAAPGMRDSMRSNPQQHIPERNGTNLHTTHGNPLVQRIMGIVMSWVIRVAASFTVRVVHYGYFAAIDNDRKRINQPNSTVHVIGCSNSRRMCRTS